MPKITESAIELFAIKKLEDLGYHYLYGLDIASDGAHPERDNYEQVLLLQRLKHAVRRINPDIPVDAQSEAIKEILRIASPELIANNETFHRFLTEGIPVTKRGDVDDRGDHVRLIDFNDPDPQFRWHILSSKMLSGEERWIYKIKVNAKVI
jgi:type I restriction enzyme R subunit